MEPPEFTKEQIIVSPPTPLRTLNGDIANFDKVDATMFRTVFPEPNGLLPLRMACANDDRSPPPPDTTLSSSTSSIILMPIRLPRVAGVTCSAKLFQIMDHERLTLKATAWSVWVVRR